MQPRMIGNMISSMLCSVQLVLLIDKDTESQRCTRSFDGNHLVSRDQSSYYIVCCERYEKRFGPWFTEPVVAGLDDNHKPPWPLASAVGKGSCTIGDVKGSCAPSTSLDVFLLRRSV